MAATQSRSIKPASHATLITTMCEGCGELISKIPHSRVPKEARVHEDLCTKCTTPAQAEEIAAVQVRYLTRTSGSSMIKPSKPLSYQEGLDMINDDDSGLMADPTPSKATKAVAPKAAKAPASKTAPKAVKATAADEAALLGDPAPAPAPKAAKATKATKPVPITPEEMLGEPAPKATRGKAAKNGPLATVLAEENGAKPTVAGKKGAARKVSKEEAELLGDAPKAAKATKPVVQDTGKLSSADVLEAIRAAGPKGIAMADLAKANSWMPVRLHGAALALKMRGDITYADKHVAIAKKGKK